MDPTYRTKAIILNRQILQEVDSRVVAYSYDRGKLELVARGTAKISSKLAGHLEPFNLVDLMVITGRGTNYAGAADNLSVAVDIKSDWDKLSAGTYVLKLYERLIKPGVSDKKAFLLLAEFIYWLNVIEASPLYYQLIARLAVWRFLNILGIASMEVVNGDCPVMAKDKLKQFSDGDLVESLKNLRLKISEARALLKYLDDLTQRLID